MTRAILRQIEKTGVQVRVQNNRKLKNSSESEFSISISQIWNNL